MNLTKGIEQETIAVNIHRSTVLNIGIMVTGLLLVIGALPALLRQVYLYVQYNKEKFTYLDVLPRPDTTLVIILIAEILIGLLMLGYNRTIVSYIELKRKPKGRDSKEMH